LFAAASRPKELWAVEGAGHENLYTFTKAEYERRVGDFLAGHLTKDELQSQAHYLIKTPPGAESSWIPTASTLISSRLRFRPLTCYRAALTPMLMDTARQNIPAEKLRSELAARFQRPLMSFFLRRIKDRSLAEDLTQDVLLKVVRASERGQIERADSYVFKVAINLLRDHRRRALRAGPAVLIPLEEDRDGQLESELVEAISPERVLLSEDSLADVLRSLGELGELTRNIFILFRLENMKQKDIAALYGIGQSTVEKHVVKAVVHLANRYGHD
jgi:RNA polymerase sigma-70 factor (ECF subfamily)